MGTERVYNCKFPKVNALRKRRSGAGPLEETCLNLVKWKVKAVLIREVPKKREKLGVYKIRDSLRESEGGSSLTEAHLRIGKVNSQNAKGRRNF